MAHNIKPGVATASRNVLVAVENNLQENYENRLTVNGYLNYDISKDLVFNSSSTITKSPGRQSKDSNPAENSTL